MSDSIIISEPGIYGGISAENYFADPCETPSFTQSLAKTLIDYSPGHARMEHPRLVAADDPEPEAEKYVAVQAIGNAAHRILLGRGKELAEAKFDNFKTKDAQKFRADNEGAGLMVILSKHLDRAVQMVRAARRQLHDCGHADAFNDGVSEAVIAWKEGGLWLRSMIDWHANTTAIYDLKTTGLCCAPHAVIERPSEAGWDIQAAMHERGLDILDPDNAGRRRHFYVAQENFAPYALSVVEIGEADLTMGRKKLHYAVDMWTHCMATGRWPTYLPEVVHSRPKPWTEKKWLEREVDESERRTLPKAKFDGENLRAG